MLIRFYYASPPPAAADAAELLPLMMPADYCMMMSPAAEMRCQPPFFVDAAADAADYHLFTPLISLFFAIYLRLPMIIIY